MTAHARGSGRKWYVTDRAGNAIVDQAFRSKNLARLEAARLNSGATYVPPVVVPDVPELRREAGPEDVPITEAFRRLREAVGGAYDDVDAGAMLRDLREEDSPEE